MSNPRPEEWAFFQGAREGVKDAAKVEKLWGKIVRPSRSERHDARSYIVSEVLFGVGQEALAALRAQVATRFRGKETAKRAFPALWSGAQIRERALVLTTPGGAVPVAHLGPEGFTLLTEQQAGLSTQDRAQQEATAPPPGKGFPAASPMGRAGQAVTAGLTRAGEVVSSPLVSIPVKIGGAILTANAINELAGDPASALFGKLKRKLGLS